VKQVCFVGVGSNLDGPIQQSRRAWAALARLAETRLVKTSSLYRSNPMGPGDQPAYINSVVELHTGLSPLDLLDALQGIEADQGRVRGDQRWMARTLDLDLLLYGQQVLSCERLSVPHPGVTDRSFVLLPLLEVAPGCVIPGGGPAAGFIADAPDYQIHRVQEISADGT